ncbi:MAG: chemotaxis protein CheB [Bacteroidales bacterium]|nr:chemotaxis protein CheB [Bacteroidales bacterium]
MNNINYRAIVIGTSAGGMDALEKIIPKIPGNFSIPIIIVRHLHANTNEFPGYYLIKNSALKVKEADEKESIKKGYAYIAPVNYHLLVDDDETFSLSVDEKVNYSRPSIDVLFQSAAEIYKSQLIGIILTGANKDGAEGLKIIKQYGGLTIVQDPEEAKSEVMPRTALNTCKVDYIFSLKDIADYIIDL